MRRTGGWPGCGILPAGESRAYAAASRTIRESYPRRRSGGQGLGCGRRPVGRSSPTPRWPRHAARWRRDRGGTCGFRSLNGWATEFALKHMLMVGKRGEGPPGSRTSLPRPAPTAIICIHTEERERGRPGSQDGRQGGVGGGGFLIVADVRSALRTIACTHSRGRGADLAVVDVLCAATGGPCSHRLLREGGGRTWQS